MHSNDVASKEDIYSYDVTITIQCESVFEIMVVLEWWLVFWFVGDTPRTRQTVSLVLLNGRNGLAGAICVGEHELTGWSNRIPILG